MEGMKTESLGLTPMDKGALEKLEPCKELLTQINSNMELTVEMLRNKFDEQYNGKNETAMGDITNNLQTIYSCQFEVTNMAIDLFGPEEAAKIGFEHNYE